MSELCKCHTCGNTDASTSSGFTHLSSGDTTKILCPQCWNEYMADRMGIEAPAASLRPLKVLDADGMPHTFEFAIRLSTGLGITATEVVNGEVGMGYEFAVLEHPETPVVEAYSKLIAKITAGLSAKYLKTETNHRLHWGQTTIAGSAINGRIVEDCDNDRLGVVVDGRFLTFEEFGRALSPYAHFNFRIEMFDPTDAPLIAANPERPDPVPWLKRGE